MDLNRNLLSFQYNNGIYRNRHKKRLKKKYNIKFNALRNTWFAESYLNLQTMCQFIVYLLTIKPPHYNFLESEFELSAQYCQLVEFLS